MTKWIAVLALALSLSSCENLTPKEDTKAGAAEQAASAPKTAEEYLKQIQAEKPLGPAQRFVPLAETNGAGAFLWGVPRPFLALDTVTGQLCKTWDFTYDLTDGRATDPQKLMSQMPACYALYSEKQKAK